MTEDELEKQMLAQAEKEYKLVPRPAVKHVRQVGYYPEIMLGNTNWAVGEPVGSHSEARAIAQKAANEMLDWLMRVAANKAAQLYEKAKP